MSAWKLYTVHCDGCSYWCEAGMGDTAREARAGLRTLGWRLAVVERPNTGHARDYCPWCVSAGAPRRGV